MPETVAAVVANRYIHVICACGREHDLEPSDDAPAVAHCPCGLTHTASRNPADRHLLLVTT